jgi:isoquinoline 1-oxidoreductase subunit beta
MLADGKTSDTNFGDYPILCIKEIPKVNIEIMERTGPLGGVGEQGLPPLAPALVNALRKATNRNIKQLPLTK